MNQSSNTYTKLNNRRYGLVFLALVVLIVVFGLLNLMLGSVDISLSEVIGAFTGASGDSKAAKIIIDIRMPRLIAAFLLGGALSVAGFLLQTFFDNPIAGPFVLGISSGSKLLVAIAMIMSLNAGRAIGSWGMILAAFIGAMASMGIILAVSRYTRNMGILIICGVMIGYFCSAITEVFITFADDSNIVNLHNWSQGSFSGITWENVLVITVFVVVTMVATFQLSKPMGAFQLGEVYAENLGVNIKALKFGLIMLSSLLAACVTAFAGPIAFVGIAVPQLLKRALKTVKPILMTPACFLGGGAFCLLSDLIARIMFAPTELSIGVVTSILGAPVVVYIMIKRQVKRHE